MAGAAENYHRKTGYDPHDMGSGPLDRGIQPEPFKNYPGLERKTLPPIGSGGEEPLSAIMDDSRLMDTEAELDLERLARILAYTHALTGQARYGSEVFYFRSVPSAGALYPFELYIAVSGVAGVEDGLYHHDVRDQSLTRLRSYKRSMDLIEGFRSDKKTFPVLTFFLTSIFFRSSWKYRDRAYRYNLLDTGHLAENLALALKSERLAFQVHYDFDDSEVNALLGVDPKREGCLAVFVVPGKSRISASDTVIQTPAEKIFAAASKVSPREADYPSIREIHAASSRIFSGPGEIDMLCSLGLDRDKPVPVPRSVKWPPALSYQQSLIKRRSRRDFTAQELPSDHFSSLVDALCFDSGSEVVFQASGSEAIAVGLITGRVAGWEGGFYLLHRKNRAMSRVAQKAYLPAEMSRACLGQRWLADCAVQVLFLSNLELLEKKWGPRGYRYAMMAAGRLGQRLYLVAASFGIGCCGVGAFYDGEAAFLMGISDHTNLLYVVGVGPVRGAKM